MEISRKFDGDVTTANDDELLRLLWQCQGLIAGEHTIQIASRDGQACCSTTRRYANVLCSVLLTVHLHGVGIHDARVTFEVLHSSTIQQFGVDAVQARDLTVFGLNELVPVQAGRHTIRQRPAIALAILDLLKKMAAVDQELLRHAAADDAGATETSGCELCADDGERQLCQGHLGFVLHRSPSRAADATAATANGEEVEIIFRCRGSHLPAKPPAEKAHFPSPPCHTRCRGQGPSHETTGPEHTMTEAPGMCWSSRTCFPSKQDRSCLRMHRDSTTCCHLAASQALEHGPRAVAEPAWFKGIVS
mmetsp:Transcript_55438/g.104098  ORF Transcript_55438/g.104098 Transcript_55438/m.104098 type:complete len:305 (-) Transcript_55438:17-931(-)